MNAKKGYVRTLALEPALAEAIRQAALRESMEAGHNVSMQEWIAEACRQRLRREGAK